MASRSNKSQRSYGTPAYTPPSASSGQGRPQAGQGTSQQRRAAIDADTAAARAGAMAAKKKRLRVQAEQMPAKGTDMATSDLSALNAARTIKKKQASDKKAIDDMSR